MLARFINLEWMESCIFFLGNMIIVYHMCVSLFMPKMFWYWVDFTHGNLMPPGW